jgi:hypothetical protein
VPDESHLCLLAVLAIACGVVVTDGRVHNAELFELHRVSLGEFGKFVAVLAPQIAKFRNLDDELNEPGLLHGVPPWTVTLDASRSDRVDSLAHPVVQIRLR